MPLIFIVFEVGYLVTLIAPKFFKKKCSLITVLGFNCYNKLVNTTQVTLLVYRQARDSLFSRIGTDTLKKREEH